MYVAVARLLSPSNTVNSYVVSTDSMHKLNVKMKLIVICEMV